MNIVLSSTINEGHKIISKKKNIVLVLIAVLITGAASAVNFYTNSQLGFQLINNVNLPVSVLNFITSFILPLFIFMVTGDLFSEEFSNNSIHLSLVRPISRYKIYISKVLSIGLFTLGVLMITFVVSFVASLFGGSLGEVFLNLPDTFLKYLFAVIPMTMTAVIAAFTAQFFKSSGGIVVVMVLFSILLSALSTFLPGLSLVIPTTYIGWYRNFSVSGFDITSTLIGFMFIISYVIIFLSAGIYVFEKKDV